MRGAVVIALLCASCDVGIPGECQPGTSRCGEKCIPTDNDVKNCGACGMQCAEGQVCSKGACDVVCHEGYASCGTRCAKLASDPNDCGACDHACGADHAVPTCTNGACTPICLGEFADCDNNPDNGCESDLANGGASCGKCGHDCLGGGCVGGMCQPVPLANYEGTINSLAIDQTNVYWSAWDNAGWIRKCAKAGCGGVPTVLAQNQSYARIAVDGTNVYWSTQYEGAVKKCAIAGCSGKPTTLASNQGDWLSIATDGVNVYWTVHNYMSGGEAVRKCAVGGCSAPTEMLKSPIPRPDRIVTDGQQIYFTYGTDITLSCPVAGCATLPTWIANARLYTIDATHLYLREYLPPYGISRCSLGGCNGKPTLIAQVPEVASVTSDGKDIYWTRYDNGTVSKCAIESCVPTVIAVGLPRAQYIEVDERAIYFGTSMGPMRLAK